MMRRTRSRLALVAVSLAAGAAMLSPSASAGASGTPSSLADLWVTRYDGSAHQADDAKALVVSPDGSRVFVTGYGNSGPTTQSDFATVAHDAATGALLWAQEYNGPVDGADGGTSVAVAPDGSKVFVTGYSPGTNLRDDYLTLAYDAGSGGLLWSERYNGPGNGRDDGNSVGVSPDGSTVFVTGGSRGASSYQDYATLAFDANSGDLLWQQRYDGPVSGDDEATSLAVSPDGSRVVVTGSSHGGASRTDYATVAYDAHDGTPLWVQRYAGRSHAFDDAAAVVVAPDGSRVFVTGESGATNKDYATVAYDSATGSPLWLRRYDGAGDLDQALSIAVSPDGSKVVVTGNSYGSSGLPDYATVAYDSATGSPLWVRRFGASDTTDVGTSIAVAPDGSELFVTGYSHCRDVGFAYATVEYDAANGSMLDAACYSGPPAGSDDFANAVAVSPDGSSVFVTGESHVPATGYDYATVAYTT